jgi:hypothetical protein
MVPARAEEPKSTDVNLPREDLFRLDVTKVFSAEEISDLCNQKKEQLGTPEALDRCYKRRPMFITSRAPNFSLAMYRAMVDAPTDVDLKPGDVIELSGQFDSQQTNLKFIRVVCRSGEDECLKNPKRGASTGKVDSVSGLGETK